MDGIAKPPVNRDDWELIEDRAERVIEEISKREREAAVILDVKNNKKRVFRKRILVVFTVLLFCFISFCGILFLSYNSAINYKTNNSKKVNFNISKGESLDLIAQKLADKKIIISKNSFIFYARMNNKRNILAGSYQLSSSMTIPEVLDILNKGQAVDSFNITFLPGGTVKMAKNALLKAGYSKNEIDDAFSKDYSGEFPTLFSGKPKNTDLEGFLYGQTHNFKKGTKVENILRRYFADFEAKIKELNLENKFKQKGLSLYEGIILSSIVQKETLSDFEDQQKVAGVFYNRIKAGMTLGSDVTYQYIADKTGAERTPNLESPYNLRKYKGLTPTPIATPGLSALKATASPAEHNYLFFLSGDDDKTYYGRTDIEHQDNIKKYCAKKCLIL